MVHKTRESSAAAEKTKTPEASWPDFAVSLYDKLTGRGAEITYEFEDFNLFIPAKMGEEVNHFHWKIDGILNIRTRDQVNRPGDEE
jgi:hypothetical protein